MADRWEDWFEPGETLLWEGAPARGIHAPFRNAFMTAFGTPFFLGGVVAFSVGAQMAFSFSGVGSLIAGFGLMAFSSIFLCVGIGMVAGPWVYDLKKHERVRYALSNRAGYVATRWFKRQMNVIPLSADAPVEYDEGRGNTGSVWFWFETTTDSEGDVSTKKQGFEAISDAKEVYTLVRDTAAALEGVRT